MKSKMLLSLFFIISTSVQIARADLPGNWPLYYWPIPAEDPQYIDDFGHSILNHYGAFEIDLDEGNSYHRGLDIGITPNLSPSDVEVFPILDGYVDKIEIDVRYSIFTTVRVRSYSGSMRISYCHLDELLRVGRYDSVSSYDPNDPSCATPLGFLNSTSFPSHVHVQINDWFPGEGISCRNPGDLLTEAYPRGIDTYSIPRVEFIEFFSDDAEANAQWRATLLEKNNISGKVDIIAAVYHQGATPSHKAGVQSISYSIYKGTNLESLPIQRCKFLDYRTFNMSFPAPSVCNYGVDFLPNNYSGYNQLGGSSYENIPVEVIYATDSRYGQPYGSIYHSNPGRQSYIVSNNTDPFGDPNYLDAQGSWDTTQLSDGVYTIAVEAWDYGENLKSSIDDLNSRCIVVVHNSPSSRVLVVSNNDPSWPYQHIGEALADSNAGDVIHVMPGIYCDENFPLIMVEGVTLQGDDARTTIIQNETISKNYLIQCDSLGADTIIENLQLTGGYAGIWCNQSSPIIRNCIIHHNGLSPDPTWVYSYGGGIYFSGDVIDPPIVVNNLIFDNVRYGIGTWSCLVAYNNTITGQTFASAERYLCGAGITFDHIGDDYAARCHIKNNIITGNYDGIRRNRTAESEINENIDFNLVYNIGGGGTDYCEIIWNLQHYTVAAFWPTPGTHEFQNDPVYEPGPYPTSPPTNNYYLNQSSSPGINSGDNSVANYLTDFQQITTSNEGVHDTFVVDRGFHYHIIPTATPTSTGTCFSPTPVFTPTFSPTPVGTWFSATPTNTRSPTQIPTATRSATPSPTGTWFTQTATATRTPTPTKSPTCSPDPTSTPTNPSYSPTQSPITPTPTPTFSGVCVGETEFSADDFFTTADQAVILLNDCDRNENPSIEETVEVLVTSSAEPTPCGITLILTETNENSGIFATSKTGQNLGFSIVGNDDDNELIFVSDDCVVTLLYTDDQPTGVSFDTAVWHSEPPTPIPTPCPFMGTVLFDRGNYYSELDQASVVVWDPDLNENPLSIEYVSVSISSSAPDSESIDILLSEVPDEFGNFASGESVGFSLSGSSDELNIIKVSDECLITAAYCDDFPIGQRIDTAIWHAETMTPTVTPTSTPTHIPTSTRTPTVTATPTYPGSTRTQTPTRSPTPTLTPTPAQLSLLGSSHISFLIILTSLLLLTTLKRRSVA